MAAVIAGDIASAVNEASFTVFDFPLGSLFAQIHGTLTARPILG